MEMLCGFRLFSREGKIPAVESAPLVAAASDFSHIPTTHGSSLTAASQTILSNTASTETVISSSTAPPMTAPPVTEPPSSPETTDFSGALNNGEHYVQQTVPSWNLRLVNAWNRMTQEQSEELPITDYHGLSVDSRIVDSLNAMLSAGSAYGLYVTSGYRAYSLQQQLFENKIGRVMRAYGCSYEEAADIAATEVARPGTSEHNTGLAVDLLYNGCSELERYWEDGEAFTWMMAHCAEYGFILRFPEGQQAVTGVIYEPWHYRYVGVEAAQEIMHRGITLEQYLQEKGM